jgi:hypothetical protein
VLFADETHVQAAQWIGAALGRESTSVQPHARDRLRPAGLLLLGCFIGIVPLAALLWRRDPAAAATPTPATAGRTRIAVGALAGARCGPPSSR